MTWGWWGHNGVITRCRKPHGCVDWNDVENGDVHFDVETMETYKQKDLGIFILLNERKK